MDRTISVLLSAAALAASFGAVSAAQQRPSPTSAGFNTQTRLLIHASKSKTIYDQNDNGNGLGIVSQNFESSFDAYDSQAADDFTVPAGAKWTVQEVDVSGIYFNGSGPAKSENVFFYKDSKGLPGKPVKHGSFTVTGADNFGSFAINLGKGVKLGPGTYWVSVQANMDFSQGGEWGWNQRSIVNGNPAAYRAPNGTECTEWVYEYICFGGQPADHMFALKGKAKGG